MGPLSAILSLAVSFVFQPIYFPWDGIFCSYRSHEPMNHRSKDRYASPTSQPSQGPTAPRSLSHHWKPILRLGLSVLGVNGMPHSQFTCNFL